MAKEKTGADGFTDSSRKAYLISKDARMYINEHAYPGEEFKLGNNVTCPSCRGNGCEACSFVGTRSYELEDLVMDLRAMLSIKDDEISRYEKTINELQRQKPPESRIDCTGCGTSGRMMIPNGFGGMEETSCRKCGGNGYIIYKG